VLSDCGRARVKVDWSAASDECKTNLTFQNPLITHN